MTSEEQMQTEGPTTWPFFFWKELVKKKNESSFPFACSSLSCRDEAFDFRCVVPLPPLLHPGGFLQPGSIRESTVSPTFYTSPNKWQALNKYYLSDLINKYEVFNECQESWVLFTAITTNCKTLLAVMPADPAAWVNSVQHRLAL